MISHARGKGSDIIPADEALIDSVYALTKQEDLSNIWKIYGGILKAYIQQCNDEGIPINRELIHEETSFLRELLS